MQEAALEACLQHILCCTQNQDRENEDLKNPINLPLEIMTQTVMEARWQVYLRNRAAQKNVRHALSATGKPALPPILCLQCGTTSRL